MSSICKSADHLFLPVLEVYDPLLRCVRCNVFAYQDTVKELAKRRPYPVENNGRVTVPATPKFQRRLRRVWRALVKIRLAVFPGRSAASRARTAH